MNLKEWAILAQESYTTQPDLGKINASGRVVFVQSQEGLILAIPGTNNIECLLADVDILTHDAGECGIVHGGIWDAFDPVWLDVSQLSVYALVGHSEGAAGAIFLAARLCLIGKAPKVVYAFEPPHTSIDSKLADIFTKYNVELHVLRHGLDIITTVAIPLPEFPWQHPKPLELFGKACLPFDNIEDHLMKNIIADL
jgi:hypothetical protein